MKIAVAGATGRVGRHVAAVLTDRGHQVVPISRSGGVDLITGDGVARALTGVQCVIDTATSASPEQQAATEFFTTAASNLHEFGGRAGVARMVMVSIIGCDRFTAGYGVAVAAHEQAMLAGPIPVSILRSAQFHEFVAVLMEWGRQGDAVYLPKMRSQLVAARAVAEALANLATAQPVTGPIREIAGPREENLAEMAQLLAIQRGDPVRIEEVSNTADPDAHLNEDGSLLPGPHAILAGPTFSEWLDSQS